MTNVTCYQDIEERQMVIILLSYSDDDFGVFSVSVNVANKRKR